MAMQSLSYLPHLTNWQKITCGVLGSMNVLSNVLYILDRLLAHYRADTQKQTNSFTPTGNLQFPVNLTCMSGGGNWSPWRELTQTWGEHAGSTKKGPSQVWIQDWATMLPALTLMGYKLLFSTSTVNVRVSISSESKYLKPSTPTWNMMEHTVCREETHLYGHENSTV